jgi:hypothetical protein
MKNTKGNQTKILVITNLLSLPLKSENEEDHRIQCSYTFNVGNTHGKFKTLKWLMLAGYSSLAVYKPRNLFVCYECVSNGISLSNQPQRWQQRAGVDVG